MGALAEAFVAYAQPLLDQTDGSEEQLNKAFAISQLCYNLALLPDDQRDTMLGEMQQTLGMDDEEFAEFRRSDHRPDDPATRGDVPRDAPAEFRWLGAEFLFPAGPHEKGGAWRKVSRHRSLRTVSLRQRREV